MSSKIGANASKNKVRFVITKKTLILMTVCWMSAVIPGIVSLSTGAPASQCNNMTPGHPGKSLPLSQSPYRIALSKDTFVPFGVVQVTILADEPFSGFMLQARDADDVNTTYVGTFQPQANTKFVCGQHGLTHISPTLKDSQNFTWRAPLTGSPNVVFRLTIVKNYFDYYVDLRSDVLRPNRATTSVITPKSATTTPTTFTSLPVTTTTQATTSETTATTTTSIATTVLPTKIATTTTITKGSTTKTTTTSTDPTTTLSTTHRFKSSLSSSTSSSSSSPLPSSSPSQPTTSATSTTEMTTASHHSSSVSGIPTAQTQTITPSIRGHTTIISTRLDDSSTASLTTTTETREGERGENNGVAGSGSDEDDDGLPTELSLYLPLGIVLIWLVIILGAAINKYRSSKPSSTGIYGEAYYSISV